MQLGTNRQTSEHLIRSLFSRISLIKPEFINTSDILMEDWGMNEKADRKYFTSPPILLSKKSIPKNKEFFSKTDTYLELIVYHPLRDQFYYTIARYFYDSRSYKIRHISICDDTLLFQKMKEEEMLRAFKRIIHKIKANIEDTIRTYTQEWTTELCTIAKVRPLLEYFGNFEDVFRYKTGIDQDRSIYKFLPLFEEGQYKYYLKMGSTQVYFIDLHDKTNTLTLEVDFGNTFIESPPFYQKHAVEFRRRILLYLKHLPKRLEKTIDLYKNLQNQKK